MTRARRPSLSPAVSVSAEAAVSERLAAVQQLLVDVFGRTLPIVNMRQNRTVVLFPLSSTEELDRAVSQIRELVPDFDVRDHFVSVNELIGSSQRPLLAQGGPSALDTSSGQDQESLPVPGT